jgi:hypothetical protein
MTDTLLFQWSCQLCHHRTSFLNHDQKSVPCSWQHYITHVCMLSLWSLLLFSWSFRAGISRWSLGARSLLYTRCSKVSPWKWIRSYWVMFAMCSWALSRGLGHMRLIASPASYGSLYRAAWSLPIIHHHGPEMWLAISFPADIITLTFLNCWNPGYFHPVLAHLVSAVWRWTRVISGDSRQWHIVAGTRGQRSSLYATSSGGVHDARHAHILWIPKPRVVPTTVLCDVLQSYCSSSCFDNCVLHARLVLCACCYNLPLYLHIICINCDQLTMDFCCRIIPCIQKLNYHLNFMLRTSYQLGRLV